MQLRSFLLGLTGVAVATAAASAQQKRPMTWLDMQQMRAAGAPDLSPDGSWFAYQLMTPDWRRGTSQGDVYIVHTGRGLASTRRLTLSDDKQEGRPKWLPDGAHLLVAANPDGPSQLYVMHRDSAGVMRKVTNSRTSVGLFDLSPDGNWVVYRTGSSATNQQLHALAVKDILSGRDSIAVQLTAHPTGIGTWTFSPDAKQIYFTTPDAIDSLDAERREGRFTVDIADSDAPVTTIWSLDLATRTTRPVLRDTTRSVNNFSLSKDGRWMVFRATPDDRVMRNAGAEATIFADNYLVELASGRVERLTNNPETPETEVRISPDSRWLAFSATRTMSGVNRNRRVYVRRVDDRSGQWRRLGDDFDGDVNVDFWSADSRTIYFDAGIRATQQLMALDVATGRVRQLTSAPGVVNSQPIDDPAHPLLILYTDPETPQTVYATTLATVGDRSTWIQLTNANPQVEQIALADVEEISWTSKDGTKVGGVLYKPVGWQPGRRYPLLVILHGGPHAAELLQFNGDDNDGPQVYAGAGYMVLSPNYRGSTNYGEKFKLDLLEHYFTKSYDDVMSGVDHLVAQGLVDSTQMGVAGHSAGGTLGNWILTHTNRFKAISAGAGVSNWISMYATSDFQRPREEWFNGKPPHEAFELYWDRSPLKYVRNARTPTLIYATEGDPRVPSGQAKELYVALRRLGVPTELHLYPGEQHGVPGSRNRMAHGMLEQAFMDRHVRGMQRTFSWADALATLKSDAAAVSVSEAVMQRYTGEYELAPGRTITVTLEGGQLHAQPTGSGKQPLFAESETRFTVGRAGGPIALTFTGEGLTMTQGATTRAAKKIR